MTVSVIVPTLLSGPSVASPLESVVRAARRLPDAEVLVVANGPGPYFHAAAMDDPAVRVLHCDRIGPAAASNLGIREARHRYLLFTDDDCVAPESWCLDLLEGLRQAGAEAAAAPVGVRRTGPVTAYLDYQRFFDAAPVNADTARYIVTASAIVDREKVVAEFEGEVFPLAGGQDVEFGYRIRDAGGQIAWLDSIPPVLQHLPDSIEQVWSRLDRYGRASALLFQRMGRADESVPEVLDWYAEVVAGIAGDRRRFSEFPEPRVRAVFTTLEYLAATSWLVGYLDELAGCLGHRILDVDREALVAGWREIGEVVRQRAHGLDWVDLRPDPVRLGSDPTADGDLHQRICALVAEHTRFSPDIPVDQLRATLDQHAVEVDAHLAEATRQAESLARAVGGAGLSLPELADRLRASGQTFRDGMYQVEQAAFRLGA